MTKSIIPRATPAAASFLQILNRPGYVHAVNVATGGTAGWMMLFDATVAPADGTVSPKRVWKVAANDSVEHRFGTPLHMLQGAVLVFSSTGPLTKTASATVFLSGDGE